MYDADFYSIVALNEETMKETMSEIVGRLLYRDGAVFGNEGEHHRQTQKNRSEI